MKIHLDEHADALYLRLDDSPILDSEEVSPGIVLDFNAAKEVVGVEILGVSARVASTEGTTPWCVRIPRRAPGAAGSGSRFADSDSSEAREDPARAAA
jgi:uncharacterized protein YuzE